MFQNIQKIQDLLDKAGKVLKGLSALHSTLQHLFDQFRPAGSVVVVRTPSANADEVPTAEPAE